jgi:hypothetical protein
LAVVGLQEILYKTQRRVGNWIGSSVIHLGDHNVPNALVFIDKYTQVPTILGPIIICLEQVDRIYKEDDGIHRLIDKSFGGLRKLKLDIVFDFVKCAFDGSGTWRLPTAAQPVPASLPYPSLIVRGMWLLCRR